jgi:hypothetical protein
MKHTTAAKDLKKYIHELDRRNEADRARSRAIETLDSIDPQQVHAAFDAYRDAKARCAAACAIFGVLPKARRETARALHDSAMAYARDIARRLGGSYSGDTKIAAHWGERATARTTTDAGEQYSRRCKYLKTDAKHIITLSADTAPHLMQSERIRNASFLEGLPLISLTPAGECIWVKSKGKALVSEAGWIAYSPDFGGIQGVTGSQGIQGIHCYHSTQSRAHAEAGLARKLAIARREVQAAAASRKVTRRLQLIARLCRNAVATVEDARALGYCSPGIAAFQSRHGIGDRATLPELMRTGDAAAQRLALSLARQVSRQQTVAA